MGVTLITESLGQLAEVTELKRHSGTLAQRSDGRVLSLWP
jgi:hypothetical protein